jgi:hypothetical protein
VSPRRPGRAAAAAVAALAAGLALAPAAAGAAGPWQALISPDNSLAFSFLRDGRPVFRVAPGGWGPKWAWVGLSATGKADGDRLAVTAPFAVDRGKGEVIRVRFQARRSSARQITFRYDLSADRDVPLTLLMAGLNFAPRRGEGTLTLTHPGGQRSTLKLPVRGVHSRPATARAVLGFDQGGAVALTIDPPCPLGFDNDVRVVLASGLFRKGSRTVTLTWTFPAEAALLARQADLDRFTRPLAGPDWFPFTPSGDLGPSALGMEDWLDRPAGKHGGVRIAGDRFRFADGTPVKFWGVNLSYTGCAPPKDEARLAAARYAKYGVNAVRLHKFTYPTGHMGIGDPKDSTRMEPAGLDRLDYFSAQLKRRGVYFGWSHTYGFHVGPGDRRRLLAYDEIAKNLRGNTYGLINFAEDVQDLLIETVVKLLKHRNPYTGLTYAAEPALCFIELQNEDDIFFYTSPRVLEACPTYRQRFQAQFAAWLRVRYGTQDRLKQAWGPALAGGESLAAGNILPQTNPWFFGADHLPGQKGGARRRLLDTAAFLHEVQNRFYDRFVKAIRAAGYRGPLNGSPWQAPAMLPHYYNLYSDYRVGYIDRHNYFGGPGPDMFTSMLTRPGSGYLGTGLQQVLDRPFGLSEWIHVYPNVWGAEGPAVVAVYGLGLQGWDASYQFQSQSARRVFSDRCGWFPWGVWEADVPSSLGQYPALARLVYRGDVREGEVISVRRVSPAELAAGTFSFSDRVGQRGDVKEFGGSVPPEALAAGRVAVEFSREPRRSTFPDMGRYRKGTVITSTTGQLAWDCSGQGHFTVDTPGTKAVVGFAGGKEFRLGAVRIKPASPFASIFVTALERGETLADGKRALVSALARQSNTGFTYLTPDHRVIDNGRAPILLEPVRATVTIAGRPVAAVYLLDHDGRRTQRRLPVTGGRFTIDGARDRTPYYEILFR